MAERRRLTMRKNIDYLYVESKQGGTYEQRLETLHGMCFNTKESEQLITAL